MSFGINQAARAARAVAEHAIPVASGAAAVVASTSPAHARDLSSRIRDEFELVDFEPGSKPIFRPFGDDEIAGATKVLR